jgi:hypothetical protein
MACSAPEPAVRGWINATSGAIAFLSAVTQAEIPYDVTLVPEGRRRDRLAQAARTAIETYFAGASCPSAPNLPRRLPYWPVAVARLAGRFHRRTLRLRQSRGPGVRLTRSAMWLNPLANLPS